MKKLLKITGRVQGVYYRASFADQANALGLHGWVRNCRDGSVEACVEGDDQSVQEIISWSRQGPPAAVVAKVDVSDTDQTLLSHGGVVIAPTV